MSGSRDQKQKFEEGLETARLRAENSRLREALQCLGEATDEELTPASEGEGPMERLAEAVSEKMLNDPEQRRELVNAVLSSADSGPDGDPALMLAEFHAAVGHPQADALWLRATLHREEHAELIEALDTGDLEGIARELADNVYVAYGTALAAGIDLKAAVSEVHRANMSKLGDDGKPVLRQDGKVLKGPNYRPPNMSVAVSAPQGS